MSSACGRLGIAPPAETGATFAENATLKARHAAAAAAGAAVIADDSGLEVDALGGAPGVYSARYAGEGADDAANNAKLVAALAGVPDARRGARYRCVLVYLPALPGTAPIVAEGVWEGRIVAAPRGTAGFGYDPYFFVPALGVHGRRACTRREEPPEPPGHRDARVARGAAERRVTCRAPPLALYVHMPWCVRKCPYCDFNSHPLKSDRPDAGYIDALIRDFESELPLIGARAIETVFFGGGTPSLFAPEQIARLIEALRARAGFAQDAEITLEANPGTIERGRFAGYRDAGVNRVSLGAQSFSGEALGVLGRIHTPDDTRRAVAELGEAGIDNFNLDLMYALPNQSVDGALADVEAACALGPMHISHYQLTLEPGTAFHARPPALPDEDAAYLMQIECQSLLARRGYVQYEVSAYARAGAVCRHNLNYWRFGDYVGIGAGAHGKVSLEMPERIVRTTKPLHPREYLRRVDAGGAPIGERDGHRGSTAAVRVHVERAAPARGLRRRRFRGAHRLAACPRGPRACRSRAPRIARGVGRPVAPDRSRQAVLERSDGRIPALSLCTWRLRARRKGHLQHIAIAIGKVTLVSL